MANKSKPPDERVHAICGSVVAEVKGKIIREAGFRGVSPAKVVGGILADWAKGKPGLAVDERQESLDLAIVVPK